METAGKTQHKAWRGLKVTRHSEYSMQMIGMGETGMTAMGGVDRRCYKKKICTSPAEPIFKLAYDRLCYPFKTLQKIYNFQKSHWRNQYSKWNH